jgi:hypothetical protein
VRKRIVIVAFAIVAIAGVSVWHGLAHREPVYQGKRLSIWLLIYAGRYDIAPAPSYDEREQARNMVRDCLRQLGTNAVPTLLNMLGKKDSILVSKLADLWTLHVLRARWNLPRWVNRYPAWYLNQASYANTEAILGFEILGADAQLAEQALPVLLTPKGVHP